MGGSGSGGSQGSGKVEYAAYLETAHSQMIGTTSVTTDMKAVLNTMMANSPYAVALAFNPDAQLALIDTAISQYSITIASGLTADLAAVSTYDAVADSLLDESDIAADVAAFTAILDDTLYNDVKPAYTALYRDIGAVQSSSFAIGFANIEVGRDRDVAKYTSGIKLSRKAQYIQAKTNVMNATMDSYNTNIQASGSLLISLMDGKRSNIAAKHDEEQRNTELDVLDAGWDIDTLLRGGQLLGSLGGGTTIPDKGSKLQSALGAGLAGAAAGAYVGGPVGAAVGGAVGLGVGAAFG